MIWDCPWARRSRTKPATISSFEPSQARRGGQLVAQNKHGRWRTAVGQTIWITRAHPGADTTAERVRALGHDAVVIPLLAVQILPDVTVDLQGVAALAFTSANGVRAFADKSGERGLRVFAVGAATAQAARKAGFKSVLSADGDVAALAEGIAVRRNELRGAILHPGALDLAGDLAGALEKHRVETRRLTLYETVPTQLTPEAAERVVRCNAVLLHSERAAQAL
eukprot:gene32007-54419_t